VAAAPSDTVCNGLDDDCDGVIDEEFASQSCATGAPGICAVGSSWCEEGTERCEADMLPQAEICDDGLDNDCDGAADAADAANCTPSVISLAVSSSDDDAEERVSSGGSVSLKSSDLELTEDGTRLQVVGVRFVGVGVPPDATIVSAHLQFTADQTNSEATSLLLQGEASDDASTFLKTNGDVTQRPRTLQTVSWDPAPWANGDSGPEQRTPELKQVVQEIVDRPGWSAGNAMAFVISGSGHRIADAYDGVPERAPVLEIEYLQTCVADADGDGFSCAIDCDDGDASVHPGASDLCDGIDNDCDTLVDEDYVATPTSCGVGACDAAGLLECLSGVLVDSCEPGAPAGDDALCNGRDDDCDGSVDEDYVDTATACGIGACGASGVLECVAGTQVDSCQPGAPGASDATCNGEDDDCDGFVDEDYVGLPTACGVGACGSVGAIECVAGALVDSCQPGAPAAGDTICDGLDEDCDGSVDEDFSPQSCATGELGICAPGSTSCEAGAEICEGGQEPETEICDDGLDNDCDGTTDYPDDASCTATSLQIPVIASEDDAEERISSGGSVSLTSNDLELTEDGTLFQALGLRFRDVAIPPDATILGARIQFTADEAQSVATSLTIEGHAADDAAAFVKIDGNVTSRPRTSGAIAWSPPPWDAVGEAGPDQRTPELKALVQEIVDRPGWTGGNAMAFVISGSGHRTAEAYDGVPARAAVLEVDYTMVCETDADGDGHACATDCNDSDATVYPGAPDLCDGVDNDCDGSVDEDHADSPTTCGAGACGANGLLECLAGVLVDSCLPGTPAADDAVCDGVDDDCDGQIDEDYPTQSCVTGQPGTCSAGTLSCQGGATSCVQDVSAAPDDSTCNGLDDDCDGSVDEDFAPMSCATGDPGVCGSGTTRCDAGAELCEADQSPSTEICDDGLDNDCDGATDYPDDASCTPDSISIQIITSEDDAEERTSSGGSVSLTSNDIELTEDALLLQVVGLRFRNVGIPPGASIVGARIQFTADETQSVATSLTVEGEASDHAAAFVKVDGNLTSRLRTANAVSWNPAPWVSIGDAGAEQRTSELTAIVQEIVDRPGWAAGNAMAFLISGAGHRTAEAYDGMPTRAAILEVDYLAATP
jgi:hypothetical protein